MKHIRTSKTFFKYFKRFVERELSTTFEGSKYEKIYDKGNAKSVRKYS